MQHGAKTAAPKRLSAQTAAPKCHVPSPRAPSWNMPYRPFGLLSFTLRASIISPLDLLLISLFGFQMFHVCINH